MNASRTPERTEGDLDTVMDQIKEGIRSGKYTIQELQTAMVEKTKLAARNTDQYVHDNPWQVVGIAAGVGLLIGLLMHRR